MLDAELESLYYQENLGGKSGKDDPESGAGTSYGGGRAGLAYRSRGVDAVEFSWDSSSTNFSWIKFTCSSLLLIIFLARFFDPRPVHKYQKIFNEQPTPKICLNPHHRSLENSAPWGRYQSVALSEDSSLLRETNKIFQEKTVETKFNLIALGLPINSNIPSIGIPVDLDSIAFIQAPKFMNCEISKEFEKISVSEALLNKPKYIRVLRAEI